MRQQLPARTGTPGRRSRCWRYIPVLLLCVLLFAGMSGTGRAQYGEMCFVETGYCISGRIREYWTQNGAIPIFGFPISPVEVQIDPVTGRTYFVQWFERHRLELYPDRPRPYDVLLGRIGSELLTQRGIDWHAIPPADGPQPGCLWFEQSRHNVCDQVPGAGFKTYWESHGLNDPALDSYGRSLALFGLPLTEAFLETTSDGRQIQVQWFERARFEWHPLNPPPYNVLSGLLGSELYTEQPPAAPFIDGLWQGLTSQRQRILLTLQNGTVQAILVDVIIDGEDCRETLLYIKSAFTAEGLTSLADNSFAVTIEDAEMVFSIAGTFESDTTASGTLQLATRPERRFTCVGSGSATWNATRQVEPTPTPAPPPTNPAPPPTNPTPLPALPDTST